MPLMWKSKDSSGELVLSFLPTTETRLSGLVADNFTGQLAGLDSVLITTPEILTSLSNYLALGCLPSPSSHLRFLGGGAT